MLVNKGKRGQVTVFVILAVIIVSLIGGYFLLKGKLIVKEIPAEFQPVQEYFLGCIEENAEVGISILEDKGGYINNPEFIPGSEYMPSSSQLNFLGIGIPYWYYVSGNNVIREQIPSKAEMEEQLERYLEENLACDFSEYREKGFIVELGEIKADVSILENKVDVGINSNLDLNFEEQNVRISQHKSDVISQLGKFYNLALKIYNKEKKEAFLENYAVDVLRLYAPVDGVELTCSPKIWMKQEVDNNLKEALEANMQAIRFNGKGYFVQSLSVDEDVRFLYSREWPTRIEAWDSNNNVLMAEPIGNQAGLGILGFCYVPYHFVYDLVYPVLIQVYDSKEIFQFPVAVIIDKNKAREALPVTGILDSTPELCRYANTEISVYTYNNNLEPVEADISFECLGQKCDIGKTKLQGDDAVLKEKFPQCLNGYVLAKAENYSIKRYQFSTNLEGEVNILLDRQYSLELELKVNSKITENNAVITFSSPENIQTIAYPEQKNVKLSEGFYNISVFVYKESSLQLPGMKKEVCNEIPKQGLLGVFGMTEQKCFDINLPAQELTNVIVGGGKSQEYLIKGQLEKAKKIKINVNSLPLPTNIEQLQDTFNLLEIKPVYLELE